MWLGLAIRVWAIAALGGAFRTTVEVDPDQSVVTAGPYTWIRHPAYSGLLLIVAGLGLTWGNWLSSAVCAVLPLPAVLWRIHVEEAELDRVLGDAYRIISDAHRALDPVALVSEPPPAALDDTRPSRQPERSRPHRARAGRRDMSRATAAMDGSSEPGRRVTIAMREGRPRFVLRALARRSPGPWGGPR